MMTVAIGGFLGAIIRFYISSTINTRTYPTATFLINISGSFLFGFIVSLDISNTLSLLFTTGFLGAFTTFSTFSYETIQLIEKRHYLTAAIYVISTLIIAVVGVWIGFNIAT